MGKVQLTITGKDAERM